MFARIRLLQLGVATLIACAAASPLIAADPGVSPDKIIFGQSAAMTGPAAALGLGMREGIEAAEPNSQPSFVSLEGYLVGRLIIAAIGTIKGDVSRQALLDAIYSTGRFDLGGVTLTFGAGKNQDMDKIFFTVIQPDGRLKEVSKLS
jgi:hypothetical protein